MDRMDEPTSAVMDPEREIAPPANFESFFEAEHLRLLRALYLVTGDRQEAEELMQDAFVAVWERWDRVRSMEEPTGYLYRTAMNRYRSRMRRATRAARRAIGADEARDAFADVEERDTVARALRALPERQRAAIVLTELLGLTSDEAGRLLGVKDVTVRSLASQGRSALRTSLEDRDE
jgi:RNA polymerase sigma-70 factor, ECF subfamily